MYGNVIVGVDGLQGGADAAALAAALAGPGASITLVYVSMVPFASHASTRELDLAADDVALAALLTAERDLCGGEPPVLRVSASTVGAGLEQVAAQRNAELIVVGASRRHGLSRLLGGADAKSVVHHAPCAVALAPPRYALHHSPVLRVGVAGDEWPEGEVGVARDESPEGRVAVAGDQSPEGRVAVAGDQSPEGRVAVAHAGLIAAGCGADLRAVHPGAGRGRVDRLVEFSREVDLLVCGSRSQPPLQRLAEGDPGSLPRRIGVPLVIAPPSDPAAVARWRALGQPAPA